MHGAGCNEKLVAVWQRRKRSMICKNCGANNPDGKLFCSECGARLDDAKVCPNCGAITNGKFCSDCGYDLRETEKDEKETPEIKSKRKVFGEWFIFAALVLAILGETYCLVAGVLQVIRCSTGISKFQSILLNFGNIIIFALAITAFILFFRKNKKKKYAFFSAFSVFLFIAKNGSFASIITKYIYRIPLESAFVGVVIPTVALIAGILTVLGCVLCCDKFCKNEDKRVFAGCVLCVVGLISILLLNALMPYKRGIISFLYALFPSNRGEITTYVNFAVNCIEKDVVAVLIAFTAYRFVAETRGKAHFVNIIFCGQVLFISLFQFLFYGYGFSPFIITTIALALIAFLCAVLNFAIRKGVERKTFVRIKK